MAEIKTSCCPGGGRYRRLKILRSVRLPSMAERDNLEARVAALESQVSEIAEQVRASEQDASPARVIAGGGGRDITAMRGEIRDFGQATVNSFNALREDLVDLRTHVDNGFTEIRGKLDENTGRFRSFDHQLADIRNLIIERLGPPINA
jgi:hypothetical protein